MSDQGSEGLLSPFLKAQRLKKVREFIRGRVLDYGCGTGDLGQFCTPDAYVGFDIDPDSLSIAKESYPHLIFTSQFPFLNDLDLYDSIVLSAVIEHVDDPVALLKLLKTHLNEDGQIVITTPHPSLGWAHKLGAKLGIFSAEASKEHKELLGKTALNRIASEAGLVVTLYERFLFGANQLTILKRRK
jgi:SAM-dependent methyltransferase